jgi:hypothetical protein
VGLLPQNSLDLPAFQRRDGAEGVAARPHNRQNELDDELDTPTFLRKPRS